LIRPGRTGELLSAAADARAAAGDRDGARRAYLAAADNARIAGRHGLLAGATLGLAGAGFEVTLFDDEQVALLEEALVAIGDDQLALRSKLSARLSVALSLAGHDARRDVLATEAVRLARDCGDDMAMAAALGARCDAHAGPDHVQEWAADATLIVAIGHRRHDHGIELLGRRLRLLASLEAGDLPGVDREIHEFAQLTDWLRQPGYGWYPRLWRATRAVMRGRLADQARLADEAEAMGRAAASPNVEILLLAHRHFVWLETGDLDTYLAETERWAPPGSWEQMGIQMLPLAIMRPLFAGRLDEARAALDRSADALRVAPRDAEWLTLVAQIGDLCSRLGGHRLVPWLYDTLAPYADLWSVDGIAAYAHGPVHRQLGTLAALLDRPGQAAAHFDAALIGNRAAGADLLAARTLFDRGVTLEDAASLGAARAAYVDLGVPLRIIEIDRLVSVLPPQPGPNLFRREGDVWVIGFAGSEARVRDSKGMHDLARLLAAAGRDLAAVNLVAPGPVPRSSDLGDTIDAAARGSYKARLVELESDLEDADRAGDPECSVRLHAEATRSSTSSAAPTGSADDHGAPATPPNGPAPQSPRASATRSGASTPCTLSSGVTSAGPYAPGPSAPTTLTRPSIGSCDRRPSPTPAQQCQAHTARGVRRGVFPNTANKPCVRTPSARPQTMAMQTSGGCRVRT